ncbi:NmrA family NAD(P)-binding protein [Terrimonas sp. NA20]|uniref:NmrA family NAD(P)-binding protein n=1 Tax=Terrimonas ginsenosidimutans TaxID=2908004 RepID=A0ABS9KZQ4_9BACT|nr:NmrA family NAD(P)-binding protein [Terrimonas ginsenosidimutans]MCG2617775.1 NmrA family NAD(P)-binding protein [Terrimonas ginsenosidimutans]
MNSLFPEAGTPGEYGMILSDYLQTLVMYIILGATGHIGSAVAQHLLDQQQEITIITRSPNNAALWEKKGAVTAIADIRNTTALKNIFSKGKYLFLLNPPASPHSDTTVEELLTINSILEAVKDSPIEKIVAESTYGAQPGDNIGDVGTLYKLEQGLHKLDIPSCIVRAAYYMSNWDMCLESAKNEHKLYSFFPPSFKLPMVAPEDIGKFAAGLLLDEKKNEGLYFIEGPETYSPADVAAAFSHSLKQKVEPVEIPRPEWIDEMTGMGFSDQAALSFSNMTALVLTETLTTPTDPIRGNTSLQEYISAIAAAR